MTEKRRASRWRPAQDVKSIVVHDNHVRQVSVEDISASGMKVWSPGDLAPGTEIYGRVELPYNTSPFFIRGTVTRAAMAHGLCQAAVAFANVRTVPFPEMPSDRFQPENR